MEFELKSSFLLKNWVKHARHVLYSLLSNALALMEVLISLTIQFLKIFRRNVWRPTDFTRMTSTDERMRTNTQYVRDWCTRNAVDPLPADEMNRHIVKKTQSDICSDCFFSLFCCGNPHYSVLIMFLSSS